MKKSKTSGTNSKKEKRIQAIRKIENDIDTINIGDQGAWEGIGLQIEALIQDFPKNMSLSLKTLRLCFEGVQTLIKNTKAYSFTLIEAITNALNAVEHYLLDKTDKKPVIQNAELQIREALLKEQGELKKPPKSETDRPVSRLPVSLDDAAALLIQLEPDDLSGMHNLKALLERIVKDNSLPKSCQEYVAQAIQKIEDIIEVRIDDLQITLTSIGELLEEATGLIEESPVEPDANSPDALALRGGGEVATKLPADSENTLQNARRFKDSFTENGNQPKAGNSKRDYILQDADSELLTEFITESSDLITGAEEALLTLETDPENMEAVGTVLRAFHTIKGTAAFMDLTHISDMGHHAESLLIRVRDREIRYGGGYADLSLQTLDMIKALISSIQNALNGDPFLKPDGYDDLMRILANPEAAGLSNEFDEVSTPRLGDILVAQGKVTRDTVEKAAGSYGDDPIGLAMLKSKAASVKDIGQALRTQNRMKRTRHAAESSVRVSIQRLDRLIDIVGEMVIAHSMVAQDPLVAKGNHHELVKNVSRASKIMRELQDISQSMRMVTFKATFNKMARLVRDVANKSGKKVSFITEGEDTEIDRNLVDIINDPLIHMVRNAVDHGIETPAVRVRTGKPDYGTVKFAAYHSAGNVVVKIEDDGKGLDRELILTRAREQGLVEDGVSLSDREVFNLIFEPGFSTAHTVTDISGRGVGMDVVKKNIETLGGQVEIISQPGKGSIFKMRFPLTLAIIDGMIVQVGSQNFIIPTVSIVRSIKPESGDIFTVHHRGEMLSLQEKLIPVFRLASLYNIEGALENQKQSLVMVVEDEDGQSGLLIDEMVGRQQVVIKTLGETMKDIPGISGGAIMPDGRIGLILDVAGLLKFAKTAQGEGLADKSLRKNSRILAA